MLDALLPATEAFARGVESGLSLREAWAKAVVAAEQGAAATAKVRPRLGRAAYLGDRAPLALPTLARVLSSSGCARSPRRSSHANIAASQRGDCAD